ncbi:MAG: DUF3822 family protein [Bacteroidales bacterium]|nr:DUF3822 family protein [Bacteroidales bacterium]
MDETFDVSRSVTFDLSLQIGAEGMSYCLYDTVVNKFVLLRHYPFGGHEEAVASCEKLLASDEYLQLPFKQRRVMWVSPRSTVVPEALLDESRAEQLLTFNQGDPLQEEQTFVRHLPSLKLYLLFSVPATLVRLLSACQPNIRWIHHAQPVMEGSASKAMPVSLFFYDGYMDTALFRDSRFLFYNSYPVHAPEDVFYFLSGVMEQFDVPLFTAGIAYSGLSNDIAPYLETLKSHSLRIVECEPDKKPVYSYAITEALRKRFAYLFHLHECAS